MATQVSPATADIQALAGTLDFQGRVVIQASLAPLATRASPAQVDTQDSLVSPAIPVSLALHFFLPQNKQPVTV